MKKFLILIIVLLKTINTEAQTRLTGTVLTKEKVSLSGVNILLEGTNFGVITNEIGAFDFEVAKNIGTITISYLGYKTIYLNFEKSTNFGIIELTLNHELLPDVVLIGTTDLVAKNKNPIAVSTIGAREVEYKKDTHSITELLTNTPSVYVSKSGGGIGDENISIRGFNQHQIAVLLNGIPMNDMETSAMYWSNLLGLENVLSTVQVQRGLGLSRLAISSVGGTINYITKDAGINQEINFFSSIGNNASFNTQLAYASGRLNNGFSTYINIGRQAGNGYVNGTAYQAYNYYFNLAWKFKVNKLQFMLLGSPQHHGQQNTLYYNRADLSDYLRFGRRYNYNFGYLNHKPYNWNENYFHKPVLSFSWAKKINRLSHLSLQLYASFGRGGGTSGLGSLPDNHFASSPIFRNKRGEVRFDDIYAYNTGESVVFSDGNTYQRESDAAGKYINGFYNQGISRQAFTNSHQWFGVLANYKMSVNKNVTYSFGVDLRYSKGTNYIRINNLFGADAYFDFFNINNPNHLTSKTYEVSVGSVLNIFKDTDKDDKVFFYVDDLVKWGGVFGSVSYKNNNLSGFLQISLSHQSFQRIDYFGYLDSDSNQKSAWISILGGTVKTGINYKFNQNNTIYINTGFYSKQPDFNVVFLEFNNNINNDYRNEKVFGYETGYGYHANNLNIKAGIYYTEWTNKFNAIPFTTSDTQGVAKILDAEQLHQGFEFEAKYTPLKSLRINSMVSIGNWKFTKNLTAKAFNNERVYIGDVNLKLKDLKVPGTAQFTASIGVTYNFKDNFNLGVNQRYVDELYASIAPEENWVNNNTPLQLPSYTLTDLNLSYQLKNIATHVENFVLKFAIRNLFDTMYITESATNYQNTGENIHKWHGIDTNNKVFFGFGRTWNLSVRIKLR